MKKIIELVCLIVVLSTCCTSFAFDDINDINTIKAANELSRYSIINGYEDGTFKPENTITRAEFAKIIVGAANLYNMVDETIGFEDTKNHWAEDYIKIVKYKGIINGMTEKTFEPDSNLTYEQAIKMIVCMLGYGEQAESEGGYPEGYLTLGNELGLTDNLNYVNKDYAKRGDIAVMIYNALGVEYMITDEHGKRIDYIAEGLTLRKIHEDLLEFNSFDD